MRSYIKITGCLLISGVITLLSCRKDKSYEHSGVNKPPIAIAGPDQVITLPADSISLDGSASNDPDGTISVALEKNSEKLTLPLIIQSVLRLQKRWLEILQQAKVPEN